MFCRRVLSPAFTIPTCLVQVTGRTGLLPASEMRAAVLPPGNAAHGSETHSQTLRWWPRQTSNPALGTFVRWLCGLSVHWLPDHQGQDHTELLGSESLINQFSHQSLIPSHILTKRPRNGNVTTNVCIYKTTPLSTARGQCRFLPQSSQAPS